MPHRTGRADLLKLKLQVRVLDDGQLAAQCRSCFPTWEGNHLIQEGEGMLVEAYYAALQELKQHVAEVHA